MINSVLWPFRMTYVGSLAMLNKTFAFSNAVSHRLFKNNDGGNIRKRKTENMHLTGLTGS